MINGDDYTSEQTLIGKSLHRLLPKVEIGHFLCYTTPNGPVRVRVEPGGLIIGRSPPADLQIPEPNISRRHCRVELVGEGVLLTDLASTNGTFLDGKRLVGPVLLIPGAQFSAGAISIRYERRDLSEIAEEAVLAEEIKRAEEYVRAILPPPVTKGPVLAEGCFVPSSKLGGDAFGYQFLDDENFAGFVLDVSGHGIGSAMLAVNAANLIRRRTLPDVDFRDPSQVARALNQALPMEEHNGLMITMWSFCYHLPTRTLSFCAAGHHAAYLMAPGDAEPAPVWLRSPALGMMPTAKYALGTVQVPEQARLYVFTDGCFELALAEGEYWSQEGLRDVIKGPPVAGLAEPQRIYQAVRAVARPGPFDDDFSMLVVTFN